MSAGPKLSLERAVAEAEAFATLIIPACDRYMVAGSVRRRRPEVGDIEHVCIGRAAEHTPEGGMFPETVNALLERLDTLLAEGVIARQIKSDGRTRWGDRYRAVLYRGVPHEVWICTEDNWGCQLAIRTGPAELSQELVTRIKGRGQLRQVDGYLVSQRGGARYPCPAEEMFFAAAGMACPPPEQRRAP